ncbi:MAG: BamA/TamA family outer membrane protein [Melioribacteraceae bacterium]|nr:BamA/TamA family outer membrane protein [Melioribacteraceae bacterium]
MRKRIFLKIIFFSLLYFNLTAQEKINLNFELVEKKLPFGLTEKIPKALPKIGIALSGGGSRALSQVGVLKAFEEKNIPVEIIVGTSMGSIVGGLYSAGYRLNELDSIMKATNWEDFFSAKQAERNELFVDQKITEDKALLTLRLNGLKPIIPTSLSSGQRAANFLNLMAIGAPLYNDSTYDLFKNKFRAVSADLVSGKEVIIEDGPLGAALRASSSVTLLLPPVKKDTMLLVDGGLVANVPVKETKKIGADIVIAVNSSSPLYDEEELDVPWRIADQLVSIPMKILNSQQLAEADFIITPDIGNKKNSDFTDLNFFIEEGYKISSKITDNIYEKFKTEFKNKINEEYFFENLEITNNTNDLEKRTFDLIENKKKVSSKEILFAFYKVFQDGYWSEPKIYILKSDSSSILKIDAKQNLIVKQIDLTGAKIIPGDSIISSLRNLIDKPFSARKTFENILNVLRIYKRNGYSFAKVEKVFYDSTSQAINIKINEGIISDIDVIGNKKTKEEIITREFPLRVGDYFKYEVAYKGLTNLRSTNLFDQIELSVISKDDKNKLLISLLEKESSIIRLGMRVDNEYLTQVSADIRDENFNGTGTEIGATFSGGIRNGTFSVEQKANRVFDSYFTYKVRAFYDYININNYINEVVNNPKRYSRIKFGEYKQSSFGISFGVGTQVERFGNLMFEARYNRDEISPSSNFTEANYKTNISSFRINLHIDSQNEYPYPTKGFLVNTYYETAQTFLGGDISYTKFLFDYKVFFGLRSDHVWSFRTLIGSADKTLPLSQQFSLGGQNSFFGMREFEYRGRQVFVSSLEVRYKFPFKIFFDSYLRLRYDLGSIWKEREQIRLKDLLHGIGSTLSFKTPIGPADFSIGKSFYFANTLTKNKLVLGPTFFYFTIGFYY